MGLERAIAKQICAESKPTFESRSFRLKCPVLDESFIMRFKEVKNQVGEAVERQLTSIQFKVLDIDLPLLELKGRCISEGLPIMESAIDSALDLWSAAFNHVTQHRRKNGLKVTDNQLRDLASNTENGCPYFVYALIACKGRNHFISPEVIIPCFLPIIHVNFRKALAIC
jgi:hypothetical protein